VILDTQTRSSGVARTRIRYGQLEATACREGDARPSQELRLIKAESPPHEEPTRSPSRSDGVAKVPAGRATKVFTAAREWS